MSSQNDGGNPSPTPNNVTSSGAGGANSDRRNRFKNRRGFNNNNRNAQRQQSKFEGREPSLKGFIYDATGERNPDQYLKTTKEIINYVGRTYTKFTTEFIEAVTQLELEDPIAPANPDPANQLQFEIWKLDTKEHRTKLQEYSNFRAGLYNVVFGQCTESLQDKLKSHEDFNNVQQDGIELLLLIKELTYTFEERRKLSDALCDVKEHFYTFKQGRYMTLQRYHELFIAQADVMEQVGVTIEDESLVQSIATNNLRANPNDADRAAAREQALAIRFIRGTNENYKGYVTHLRNSFLDQNDNYPTTLHQAYNILQRRELENPLPDRQSDGIAFATTGTTGTSSNGNEKNNNGKSRDNVTCFACNKTGHYSYECPAKTQNTSEDNNDQQQGTNLFTYGIEEGTDGFSFYQSSKNKIPANWILLDNQSTIDLFCNKNLLRNIRVSATSMKVHSNGGSRVTNLVGDLPGYGKVWYDPESIANILSLKQVKDRYQVSYNNIGESYFNVTKPDGTTFKFEESESGLYYVDTTQNRQKNEGMVFLTTVEEKKAHYTNEHYQSAVKARELQIRIGRPSTKDFIDIVTNRQISNCPITKEDILAAEDIFGPEVGSLKGKTTRTKPKKVRDVVEMLPTNIMSRYRKLTLCIDIMFVNKVPMLVSISRNIKFGTLEDIPNRKSESLIKGIHNIVKVYRQAGFKVVAALMDGEFDTLRGELADIGIALNVAAPDEHVGDIERYIRTVKERMRAMYNTLPFKKIPHRMVVEMAKSSVFWLNSFPHFSGISKTLSPRTIITGQNIDYDRHCTHQYGDYVQTHEQHNNSMESRTIGALAMRPTGNSQGSYYFYSLSAGRIINRRSATKLPMPDDVIERVHTLVAKRETRDGLEFSDRNNSPMTDDTALDEEDSEYNPEDDDDSYLSHSDDEEFDPDDEDNPDDDDNNAEDNDRQDIVHQDILNNQAEIAGVHEMLLDNEEDNEVDGAVNDINNVVDGIETEDELSDDEYEPEEVEGDVLPDLDNIDEEMDQRYGERSGRYELRPRRPRDFSHLFINSGEPMATPQMSMKKGIAMFGAEGIDAVRKELMQLHERNVMSPKHHTDMDIQQKRDALAYLMFLKRKRCGKVKGRGCADGRKQRSYISKEDAASPTVSTESVYLTTVIDAMENRSVAVIDVPGAFMQADMDSLVHVRFTGKMVELLVEIDPKYQPFVVTEKGEKVLYVQLLKALYGTIKAARLFWDKLTQKLQEWGFVCNPYDSCVANKMVNNNQLTVTWHVDDLKVSHVDNQVVEDFITQMELEFGRETPMNTSRGKVHDYLGMTLDFSNQGRVEINMIEYVKMVLHELPPEMIGSAITPAANFLFEINNECNKLTNDKKDVFVHYVMQLLYLSQRARPDIRTAISFLCTRLKNPDEDDYKKLSRVIKYLQSTVDLTLNLGGDGSNTISWWVDASFAVHPDMKGHTGGTMSLGKGCVYSTSTKQKMVSRSSTESEVIGVYDVMPQILWTSNFLSAQGFKVNTSILYQDNMSAILLETNGRASSTRRTRHMHIRFFFVKDSVDTKQIQIKHCGTTNMVADFFTKPLQGNQFRILRDIIMNIDQSSPYHSGHRSVLGSDDLASDTDIDKIGNGKSKLAESGPKAQIVAEHGDYTTTNGHD